MADMDPDYSHRRERSEARCAVRYAEGSMIEAPLFALPDGKHRQLRDVQSPSPTAATPSRALHASSRQTAVAHASLPFRSKGPTMPQESSASALGDSPFAADDTRDLLCAMLRSAEGETSDSGGSEVSPSHKRRSARLTR